MSESRVSYVTKTTSSNVAQIDKKGDMIVVNRADLEQEHRLLIARLHVLRKQLGYAPLTDKEQHRQASK